VVRIAVVNAKNFKDRVIAPSLLAADFARIGAEVDRALTAGVDNISFGPAMIETVAKLSDVFQDVHLMISRPDHYLERFIKAGAGRVTVHVEAQHDVAETLRRIRESGRLAGLALNPATPFSAVEPFLGDIDLLLCMTVVPGFGGQAFMPEMLDKVRAAAAFRETNLLSFHVEVDGGIDATTAARCYAAGANAMVAGSSTFRASDMAAAISAIRNA
jgi:ribulose-phosphate 3-epimerase